MPLVRRVGIVSESILDAVTPHYEPTVTVLPTTEPDKDVALVNTTAGDIPKAAYTGGRKAMSDTMSKEDWANKDKRISLQGLVQALLNSVHFGQYIVTTTQEDYLKAVEQASLRLAKFVAENGK